MQSSNFVNHLYGYRPNWTPLGPITITNNWTCFIFSIHGKAKPKPLSFQEFNSKMSDAWGEDDDDVIRVDPEEKKYSKPDSRVRTISGGEVRASIPTNVTSKETKKLPEQLVKKDEHKTSRPSPLSLLSKS